MNNKYIGVFDSGLGGLTVVKELKKVLPDENIIYFGDTGRVPYGTRSNDTIIKYVKSDINFLKSFDIKAIIVACGTASTVALPVIRDEMDIPVIGVVSPTVQAAVASSKSKRIAVLGTPGTIKSGKYEEEIRQLAPDAFVVNKACTLFVPIVENGCTDDEIAYHVCKKYLDDVLLQNVDTIILGCTHYPLLEQTIAKIAGPGIKLISSGREAAAYAKDYLARLDVLADRKQELQYRYYVSDSVDNFSCMADLFLGEHIHNIEKIDIENY
ncbi:MAG: glutamate racemase [Clostridia bacterium]|nr:glutamate racemase [Clostridia bacterium]